MKTSKQTIIRTGRTIALLFVALSMCCGAAQAVRIMPTVTTTAPETDPVTAWTACNTNAGTTLASTFHPLSDAAAAALVTPEPETRPYNAKPYTLDGHTYVATNHDIPTLGQINTFRLTKDSAGDTPVQENPYNAYVDGRDNMIDPTTDDLIQWAAHKWGIPENWLRAEYALESYWNSFQLGDEETVTPAQYAEYPLEAQVPGTDDIYQSMGITQIRWASDGSLHAGTNPLRWVSTSFNIDYQAATIRFFYDDPQDVRSEWGDSSYLPCQQWASLGGWNSPYPWNNAAQASYISKVQSYLAEQVWESSSFLSWQPTTFPTGVSFPG